MTRGRRGGKTDIRMTFHSYTSPVYPAQQETTAMTLTLYDRQCERRLLDVLLPDEHNLCGNRGPLHPPKPSLAGTRR